MKDITFINATSLDQAASLLGQDKAAIFAGGTDLMGLLRGYVTPSNPDVLVNIKTIPDMDYIKEDGGMLKIGALAKLADVAKNSIVKSKYAALAEAARKVASPELRNMGTIGGNLCQQVRCWYYRSEYNGYNCLRKSPSGLCQALLGRADHHSIFGAGNGCIAVNPSDVAPALIALDAKIVTTEKTIEAEDFFTSDGEKTTVLEKGEIVKEIQVPAFNGKSAFMKFAERKAIEFALVNCAVAVKDGNARICLNAVGPVPRREEGCEAEIAGKTINAANAEAAANKLSKTTVVDTSKYKIPIAKALIKRTLLLCA